MLLNLRIAPTRAEDGGSGLALADRANCGRRAGGGGWSTTAGCPLAFASQLEGGVLTGDCDRLGCGWWSAKVKTRT